MGVGLRGRWRIDVRRKPMCDIAATRMLCCARALAKAMPWSYQPQ